MENTLSMALVLKPQGIRGEVKVKLLCDSAEDLASTPRVFIGGTEYKILNVRPVGDCAFLALKGIADRNAAELLRGKEVVALRSDLPQLPDDRFYIVDIIGCEVFDDTDKRLGTICEITPARTDIYVIDTGEKKIPFAGIEGVIKTIDIQNKKMIVDSKKFGEVALSD
jgi:16S rRNA processing protein RimM